MDARNARVQIRMKASRPTRRKDPTRAAYSVLWERQSVSTEYSDRIQLEGLEGLDAASHMLRRPRNGTGIVGGPCHWCLLLVSCC